MKHTRIALVMLVGALAWTAAAAQTGGLRVVVRDAETEQPLAGAVVILSNKYQYVPETAQMTDRDGVAEFPVLRAGSGYVLQIQRTGYLGVRKEEVRVKASEVTEIPFLLPRTETEKVVVEGKAPVVQLEKTESSTTFNEEFIRDLPVEGRLYTEVLTLAPGVQDEDNDGNPNVHGARERDFQAYVGGVSNVDPLTGLRLNNVNIDTIEEIEVIQAGAGVEFGRAQGGFANIIEGQGSNEFEGLFTFTFRSDVLDGNGATNLSGRRLPEFSWIQPSVQVSGPIIRDKLWYRFSHEYLNIDQPVNTLSNVATQTTKRTLNSDMITWQVSRRNKLQFSFRSDPQSTSNLFLSSTRPPEATLTSEFGGPTYTINWVAPYSPNLLVDTIVAYQDTEQKLRPTVAGQPNSCIVGIDILEMAQCQNLETGQFSGSYPITWQDNRQRFTLKTRADFVAGKFWGMRHQFKVGFEVENERYFRFFERRPFIQFSVFTANDPTRPPSEIEQVAVVNASVAVPLSTRARAVGTNWTLYGEDQLRPLSNLTVTLGLRVDREVINSNGFMPFDAEAEQAAFLEGYRQLKAAFDSGQLSLGEFQGALTVLRNETFTAHEDLASFLNQLALQLGVSINELNQVLSPSAVQSGAFVKKRRIGNIDLSNTNFSPFLAVAWDPFKTGRTKISFTGRRLYGRLFLAIPTAELDPVFTDLNFDARNVNGQWRVDSLCAGRGACLNPTANIRAVSRDLRTPYTDEFQLVFERELAAETAIAVRLIHKDFRNQLQDQDINHNAGDFGRCFRADVGTKQVALEPSPGTGLVTDPYTGEVYEDTDPGDGDGRLDDCVGRIEFPRGNTGGGGGGGQPPTFRQLFQRPDGFLDSYVINPAWGEIFLIGNFNTIDYRAAVIELTRRQYRNWQMNASYTWSEAIGDAEDFDQILGDDRSLLKDERGFLSYDQRHVVKVNATTYVPWWGGFRFGMAAQWQSGLPYSLQASRPSMDAVPPQVAGLANPEARFRIRFLTGQRNDQRNEGWWNFDVHVAKEKNLRGGVQLQVTADIFNLLNDNSLRIFNQVNGFNAAVRRFGRQFQVGFRLAF